MEMWIALTAKNDNSIKPMFTHEPNKIQLFLIIVAETINLYVLHGMLILEYIAFFHK